MYIKRLNEWVGNGQLHCIDVINIHVHVYDHVQTVRAWALHWHSFLKWPLSALLYHAVCVCGWELVNYTCKSSSHFLFHDFVFVLFVMYEAHGAGCLKQFCWSCRPAIPGYNWSQVTTLFSTLSLWSCWKTQPSLATLMLCPYRLMCISYTVHTTCVCTGYMRLGVDRPVV